MPRRHLLCAAALAVALPLAGCTSSADDPAPLPPPPSGAGFRLVAYDSCEQLEKDLRQSAKASVGPYGFPGAGGPEALGGMDGARTMADAAGAAAVPGGAAAPEAPAFSGTNNHEQSADEPDIVKTDGRRIVTVDGGTLRVVDAASRQRTGEVSLGIFGGRQPTLLLSGDSVLVLVTGADDQERSQAILVGIGGAPTVLSRWEGDGHLVDARLTAGTARVVLRSAPRITFPMRAAGDLPDQLKANRGAIDEASVDAWLPSWSVTTGGATESGRAGCDKVTRPPEFSAGSLLSLLTFDLTRPALGNGDAVTVAADADTVYATGSSLYVAGDQRWQLTAGLGRAARPVRQETDLYRFATEGNRPPEYRAAGQVPGFLVNQYALSEWEGRLRVATTDERTSQSAVRVLSERDGKLAQTGIVDGLGKGERIYSVRFLGPVGYVVTFRQTDPLYTVDLRDPAKPRVTGELKITGYSSHLQPAGDGRLIGVGQEADTGGRVSGTQVSLFDVTDTAAPRRLAQHQVPGGQSEAEWDPHALLWWPATKLLVLPLSAVPSFDGGGITSGGALALRVTDQGVSQVGSVGRTGVRRSLVVGDTLWTVSDGGLQASSLTTLEELAWLPA